MFTVSLNGEEVGVVAEKETAEKLLQEARKELVSGRDGLVFMDVDMNLRGQAVLVGKIDDEDSVRSRMKQVLEHNIKETTHRSYAVKINNYMVNLGSREDVLSLLQQAVDKYDTEGRYQVNLAHAQGREFNVLTAQIEDTADEETTGRDSGTVQVSDKGGFELAAENMLTDTEPAGEKDFSDYELGTVDIRFAEEVEIVEVYLDDSQLTDVAQAAEEVIKEQEVNSVYEVVSGDTLSEIAIKTNIPMEQLVAMNDSLEDTNSVIRVGQELIITIPEPELSVDHDEEMYYEEIYDAPVQYVYNDSWYTNQTKTLQEPSAGFRKVVAVVSYKNDTETNREILKEEVVMEAVPKIVEKEPEYRLLISSRFPAGV